MAGILLGSYRSEGVVDVDDGGHQGLSCRGFEALSFGKKLSTTNQEIRRYDFYHPNNIFIWGNHTMDELEAFLAAPVIPALPHVLEKYSFSNWISYVLGKRRCQRIQLHSLDKDISVLDDRVPQPVLAKKQSPVKSVSLKLK